MSCSFESVMLNEREREMENMLDRGPREPELDILGVDHSMTEVVDLQSVLAAGGDGGSPQMLPKLLELVRWIPMHHQVPVHDLGLFSWQHYQ